MHIEFHIEVEPPQRFNAPIWNKEESLFFLVGLMWREERPRDKKFNNTSYTEFNTNMYSHPK